MLYSSRRRSALILLAALVVAGCSNSDADPAGAKATTEVTPSATASDGVDQSDGEVVPPVDGPSPEPSVAVSLAPSVKVGKPSDILPGVRVSVGTVKPVTVKAQLPGELAGPAAAVPVQIRNGSKSKVPFVLIAGGEDADAGAVSFRFRDGSQDNAIPVADAVKRIVESIATKAQV